MAELPKLDHRPPDADAVARGYEPTSLRAKPTLLLGCGVAVVLVVLGYGVWRFERSLAPALAPLDRPAFPSDKPSSPPLQPQRDHASLDAWDLQKMRDRENAVFTKLGWTPRPDGIGVRMPQAIVDRLREQQRAIATTQKGGV